MIVTDLQSINPALTQSKLGWGRRDSASWQRGIITAFFMLACPVIVVLPWIALEQFDNSIVATISALLLQGPVQFLWTYYPHLRFDVLFAYLGWVVFQGVLYSILTGNGIHRGQTTPSGHILEYKVNGFAAWTLSVTIAIGCAWMGVVDPSIIATHWGALLATLNVYGIIITGIFYIKAHLYPTHKRDRRFSGSFFYDLYMGIELNPRLFGRYWDVKLFHNGRPGIIGWALIDLSFIAQQYQKHAIVTNSIIITFILHLLYIADFFHHEDWYLRTIDIAHDHFGFYLAWGSSAFLPSMYTLQIQYLARSPLELSPALAALVLAVGIGGYYIFRSANNQKDNLRNSGGKWQDSEVIECSYTTADGVKHQSILLCSGWWGFSRHPNYLGDLLLSYAMCATCGLNHILPWSYAVFMTMILTHRCLRDEAKCSKKYGEYWEAYSEKVPWRLMPGVW
ncbi:uncharacterized protein N7529_011357 [Penicillium soppii]|uniref:uncharacterized protein n=1 Tax=Penicillium soppii TaxID=69789 RepID=UPI0025479213|nr:uncharacterized protein N7529_011357 [Penicillium soppii]KAJ5851972.1 hypothetical protein N7529_011357 [Penicillium soppii]